MSNDLDPRLLSRFTAARTAPLDAQFLAACLARLERERRRRAFRLAAACGAGLLLLAWKLPVLLSFSAHLADHMVSTLVVPTVQAAWEPTGLSAPGWGVSLLVGAGVLRRSRSPRRRG